MSNDPKPQQQQRPPDRTPIPVDRLVFTSPNPNGVRLPDGAEGKSAKFYPDLMAGDHGGVRVSIEHRPWMRVFRVAKARKVTRADDKTKKEVETWEPMGKPFTIPDSWAVAVTAED